MLEPSSSLKVAALLAGEDADTHGVASESAASTTHVRLQDPILSISPHVTHLFTHHQPTRSGSAPASHPLSQSASGNRPNSNSIPNGLQQADLANSQQVKPPGPSSALRLSPQAHLQQSSSQSHLPRSHEHARAQRQLFTSLSDQARPHRPGSDPPSNQAAPADSAQPSSSSNPTPQHQDAANQAEAEAPLVDSQLSFAEVYSRQRLFVCKMCRNPARGLLCEPSSVQRIDYYQGNDMPLASFLAATAPQKCQHVACGDGVTAHLRTFLHNRGRVTLSVSQTQAGRELPGTDKGQVWFWARPLQVTPQPCKLLSTSCQPRFVEICTRAPVVARPSQLWEIMRAMLTIRLSCLRQCDKNSSTLKGCIVCEVDCLVAACIMLHQHDQQVPA